MQIRRGPAVFIKKKEMWGWIYTYSQNRYHESFIVIDVNYLKRK